jgi:hypothetical protein
MKRLRTSTVTKTVAVGLAAVVLTGGAYAWAGVSESTSDDAQVARSSEPDNLGQIKTEILEYYGDVEDEEGHHHASPDSAWAKDTARQVREARRDLQRALDQDVRNPAIVLDVDDTSELTFGHNADHDFGYDPELFDEAIKNGEFPAIEPTVEFANFAAQNGVKVFFVTGRHEELRTVTLKNLANGGFPEPTEAVLKPDENPPDWLPCGLECETVEYKSSARKHIEDAHDVTIVVNMGDQLTDLEGGHAENTVKLPNPMYFIP